MSYNSGIPVGTQYLVESQPQIQSNFQTIFSTFSQNHVSLNQSTQGKHNSLLFRVQTGDPNTTIDQVALYTKKIANDVLLFFRPSNNQTAIQMNYPNISTGLVSTNPDVYLLQQYSYVAGPFVVYLGLIKGAINNQLITLTPATNLIYVGCVLQKVIDFSASIMVIATNIAANQFNVVSDNTRPKFDFYYIAIGKP